MSENMDEPTLERVLRLLKEYSKRVPAAELEIQTDFQFCVIAV